MDKDNKKPKPNLGMIRAACEWWGDVIVDAKQDNGDLLQSSMKTFFASTTPPVTKEMRDIFVSNLYNTIIEDWDKMYRLYPGGYEIHNDYGVDQTLRKAVGDMSINDLKFPMKTDMIIGIDSVRVSYGYRAPWEVIAGKDENK